MLLLAVSAAVLSFFIHHTSAKAVFAHFMVTNSGNYTTSTWADEFALAQTARIDAFALNMGVGDSANEQGVADAFAAAAGTGFQLFFSFDYAANGAWAESDVIQYLTTYGSNSAHYQYDGKPFVSTFEGTENADDWTSIKASTNCFFVPDWSSVGAAAALELNGGIADGLFAWSAWPSGDLSMDTSTDTSYVDALAGKPYMMAVSPWFFTNLPGYGKNWLWNGDDLWYDRWKEVLSVEPEFVEILTWNDYGESHYIGPLREGAFAAFYYGGAPYNYAADMPHDAWRVTLPFSVGLYVDGTSAISQELLTVWYRPNPGSACATGGTTGNSASQGQEEFQPYDVVEDAVFYSALLASAPSSVSVSIGGVSQAGTWRNVPDSGVGLYHGSVPFNGNTGEVMVTVIGGAGTIAMAGDQDITTDCTNGVENWNAWVGNATGGLVSATA
ncbi:hypothetical protein LTR85_002469 [Meristemomyces frigidus]|nr:hypothetical protein LTR85_002469 [Meristemomyces frigidus]